MRINNRIIEATLDSFIVWAELKDIIDSPYPDEKYRAKYRDSWVIFEQFRDGWLNVFCSRQEYKETFQNVVEEFNSLVIGFKEDEEKEKESEQENE